MIACHKSALSHEDQRQHRQLGCPKSDQVVLCSQWSRCWKSTIKLLEVRYWIHMAGHQNDARGKLNWSIDGSLGQNRPALQRLAERRLLDRMLTASHTGKRWYLRVG